MPVHSFVKLLRPDSIALIGASARHGSVGQVVLSNILSGGFGGRIYAVNPNRLSVEGVTWAASIDVLPAVPDLAVIVTPARDIVDIVNRLGKLGTKMAVVITAGITVGNGLRADMLAAAASHGMRLIGPNCVGALMPHVRLNASFSSVPALPGHVAMISQSGALITAILDTAAQRGLGFSCIVSVGDMADTDFADLVDVFAADPGTTAILLYVEGISATAKFLSAARAAVKIKPVIAIKAGRNAAGARAALSHTGSLAGADDVYRCAFARAGIITVETLTELFDAAEVFAAPCSIGGNRLAIVTNGGGAALSAIAVDLPDVLELDINPLLVDTAGVVALDARIVITEAANSPSRLVIRTAPADWAASLVTRTGFSFDVRPVHSDDEKVLAEFFTHVTPEDLRFRFLTSLRDVGHDRLAAMTQIDYRRDMTFLAFEGDGQTVIAVATLAGGADHDSAEIALSMRSDMKHRGVSWTLLDHVLRFAGSEGIETVVSVESADHIAAIALEREMGFSVACDEDPTRRIVSRKLAPRYVPTDTVVE